MNKLVLLSYLIIFHHSLVKAQDIINTLSLEYSNCAQNQCQTIINNIQPSSSEAQYFQQDTTKYNNCIYGQVLCAYQFYLPFSQINQITCDQVCFQNQHFMSTAFNQYQQCLGQCFKSTYSVISNSALQTLSKFGGCLSNQSNGFSGFPVQSQQSASSSTNSFVFSDINEYQNCIQNDVQCNQYNQDYSLLSFSQCFNACSQENYQTSIFQAHLQNTISCLNKVLNTSSSSSSPSSSSSLSGSGMNWSTFALTLGIVVIVVGCIFIAYRSYKKKQASQKEKNPNLETPVGQNIPIVTNFQQNPHNIGLSAQSTINQQIPLLQQMESNQLNLNSINIKFSNITQQQPEIQQTFNFNSQIDGSPSKNKNNDDVSFQMARSQLVRNKVESIFQDIERESTRKKQMAAIKSQQRSVELQRIQEKQSHQQQLNMNEHNKMLDQLRRNFVDIDKSLKQSNQAEQSAPPVLQYTEKQIILNQCDRNTETTTLPALPDENEKNNQDADTNFTKNIQDFLHVIGLKAIQESPMSSSMHSSVKSKYSPNFDQKIQDMTQKMEISQVL